MKNPRQTASPDRTPPRRSFLSKLWIALGLLAFVEVTGVVVSFLSPRKKRAKDGDSEDVIEAGPAHTFPPNSVTAFVRGKFYLVRLEDGGFLALSRRCTHLGCTVPWISKEMKFVCPCHASSYDIRGEVISPPAPRALDAHRVFIENNVVKVDISKTFKRDKFHPEQVVYPSSHEPSRS